MTNEYAGLFFRVLGGNSELFETIQAESSPRITAVQTAWRDSNLYGININPDGLWSEIVTSGDYTHYGHYGLRFIQSKAEVRPRNTAVRIWKKMN